MKHYKEIFDARGHDYNSASLISPQARLSEIDQLLSLVEINNQMTVVDIPAGGGVVASRIQALQRPYKKLYCVEPSQSFAVTISADFSVLNSPIDNTQLQHSSCDLILSLAGLHHCCNRVDIYHHWYQRLKSSGQLAVADVRADTPTAQFLNGFVNQNNSQGHQGDFISDKEFQYSLTDVGFCVESNQLVDVPWHFDNLNQLGQFCQLLFGIDQASIPQIIDAVADIVGISETKEQISINWQLQYAYALKR